MNLDKWQMSELQFGASEWNGVGAKKTGSEKWQIGELQFGTFEWNGQKRLDLKNGR